jgi:hypothetical protein
MIIHQTEEIEIPQKTRDERTLGIEGQPQKEIDY